MNILSGQRSILCLIALCAGLAACNGSSSSNSAVNLQVLAAVEALFPVNGSGWNDYVRGSWSNVTDTSCDAANDSACLHGGEIRVVEATGKADCSGLTAVDALGAFNWICDDSGATPRLISTGLIAGKSLSDLIDFTGAGGFLPNAVTVYDNGTAWGATPAGSWWTNPVAINNSGGSLAVASTLYLQTQDLIGSYSLDANKVAFVIQPGVTLTGPGSTDSAAVSADTRNHLWIEGNINADNGTYGVHLSVVKYAMLRHLAVQNANVPGAGNVTGGIYLSGCDHNSLYDITVANNLNGLFVYSGQNNKLAGVSASNNLYAGVTMISSRNYSMAGVTSNNNSVGLDLEFANNGSVAGVTANNNVGGVSIYNDSHFNTLSSVATANNNTGIDMYNSTDNVLSDLAIAVGNRGLAIHGDDTNGTDSSNNSFTGWFEIGSNIGYNCYVEPNQTNPGLDDTTCANNGSSNAIPIFNITLADSFVGKAGTDAQNADGPTASYPINPGLFDWTHFETAYRGWGKTGSSFPNSDQVGQWTTGSGSIWDSSVSAADTGANNSGCASQPCPALLGVLALPTGDDTLTQPWFGTPATSDDAGCDAMVAGSVWNNTGSVCETTYLQRAIEIPADGSGNDNLLCESGEACLYTPNIGSYQGHGSLVSAGVFTDGAITGVTLLQYASNGR